MKAGLLGGDYSKHRLHIKMGKYADKEEHSVIVLTQKIPAVCFEMCSSF